MNRLKLAAATAALLLGASGAAAQEPSMMLTLEDAIRLSVEQGPASEVARLAFEEAGLNYKAVKASFLPSINLQGSAPGLLRSITNLDQDDGTVRYVTRSTAYSNVGLSVDQIIPQTGTRLSLSSQLSRVDQLGNAGSLQWQASPLLLGIIQPIFGYNETRWQRMLEPVRFRAEERRHSEALAGIAVNIAGLFFDAFTADISLDLAEFNVAVNDTVYSLSQSRYSIGRIAENDLLQSELALVNAQTAVANARITLDRALQDLKIALGLPTDVELVLVAPTEVLEVEIDPDEALEKSRTNRSRSVDHEVELIQAESSIAQARSANRPGFNLVANLGLNQTAPTLDEVWNDPLSQQQLTVGFQVPLFSAGRGSAEIQSARIAMKRIEQQQESEREELDSDVYFEARRFAQLRLQVASAAKADTIATRRFEVSRNRYGVGLITITDLFDAQREKDAATRSYFQAVRAYWLSYFQIRRLTLHDWLG